MGTKRVLLILLDFDGVLNDLVPTPDGHAHVLIQHHGRNVWFYYKPEYIAALNATLARAVAAGWEPQIIVASTWRYALGEVHLAKLLREAGLQGNYVVGVTPKSPTQHRGEEIRAGVEEWAQTHPHTPFRVLVLDDAHESHTFGDLPSGHALAGYPGRPIRTMADNLDFVDKILEDR